MVQLIFHGVVHTCIFKWSGHLQCFLKLLTCVYYVCMYTLYTCFIFLIYFWGNLKNNHVYRKRRAVIWWIGICGCGYKLFKNYYLPSNVLWHQIAAVNFLVLVICIKHKWLALVCRWKASYSCGSGGKMRRNLPVS